jgi:phosphoglycerate dehydrogenase-like enzyme
MPEESRIELLITVPIPDEYLERLREVSPRLHITVIPTAKSEEISNEVWNQTEILYTVNTLPDPSLVPHLRWVQFHVSGLDTTVEKPLLNKQDVSFTTLSGASAAHVAEYAVTLLLALSHHVQELIASQKKAEWDAKRWQQWKPVEVRESTVGIVGYGSIGREIARLLQPFKVKILATKYDVMHPADPGYTQDGLGDPQGDLFHRLYPAQALKSMLKDSDFVVICIPLTQATQDLFGREEFDAMKPTAYLVNVSHGQIISMENLVAALQEKRIAGAALDVFPQEPLPPESPLWKLNNIIISPHIAGNSARFMERAMSLFSENLYRYITGATLLNRFDPRRGY